MVHGESVLLFSAAITSEGTRGLLRRVQKPRFLGKDLQLSDAVRRCQALRHDGSTF